jgi:hypothetical protein
MLVTVQELAKSSGGKPKCKAGGVWYFLPTDKDTGQGTSPAVGQQIEIRTGSFTMGDKTFQTIEAWRPAQSQQEPQQNQAPRPAIQGAATQANYIDEASLRFISNVVGQAIAAKTISSPGQILGWFTAAKAALEGKPAPAPFDDEIPQGDPQKAASGRW